MIAPDTIAAISSPFGEGAIAVVRMSGPRCVAIADSITAVKPSQWKTGLQAFARLHQDGTLVDEVMLSVHRAPHSYTGEDVVEIFCHGGILVTRAVLTLLLQNGARIAEPGEFTQRAFLNGKMDLTQAEAVMDLIRAQTTLALRSATEQLEGRLGARVLALREAVLQTLSHLEAYIDFPDEDIDPATGETLAAQLAVAADEMQKLLATAEEGRVLREGVRTVIFGEPNVGKSSLLNLLLGFERAIVNERPGTTRDTIEEVVNVRGIPLRLADTAGMRESEDAVEREGIERTKRQLDQAKLILHVVDASAPKALKDTPMLAPLAHSILVLNKCDLTVHSDWASTPGVRLSCKEGRGLELLQQAIYDQVASGCGGLEGGGVAINARHRDCLARAEARTQASIQGFCDGLAPEFVSVEIREALEALGEIVGRMDTEDLLDRIFGNFCIGK